MIDRGKRVALTQLRITELAKATTADGLPLERQRSEARWIRGSV